MTGWVQSNFDPKLDPFELWQRAGKAWEALTPDHKIAIWSMCQEDTQSARDICEGLLATLDSYQGTKSVKNAFREAILSTREIF
jgi:hypothetical protein